MYTENGTLEKEIPLGNDNFGVALFMSLPYSSLQLPLVNRTSIQIINIYDILVFYFKTKKGAIYFCCCVMFFAIFLYLSLVHVGFFSLSTQKRNLQKRTSTNIVLFSPRKLGKKITQFDGYAYFSKELVKSQDNVPENLQLQFLSICLGAKSGSVGLATWHDFDPAQRVHEPFKRLAVIGSL